MGEKDYVVWEETSRWPRWAAALLGVVVALGAAFALVDALRGVAGSRVDVLVRAVLTGGGIVLVGLILRTFFGRLRVVVTRTSVRLTYGYTRLIEKLVTFDEIEEVEPVRYSPVREFGGWGIRFGGGRKRAWTARGDGAVVLTLDDGVRLYVGTDDPERLARHIRTAMGRGPREAPASGAAAPPEDEGARPDAGSRDSDPTDDIDTEAPDA